jgi:hypothetical protein
MNRLHRRKARCTEIVLALFVTMVVSPRAGIIYHHHDGGDHEHVHPEDAFFASSDDLLARHHDHGQLAGKDHGEHAWHRHHQPPGPLPQGDVGIETPDPPDNAHFHWQSPFHRAARQSPPVLDRQAFCAPITTTAAPACSEAPAFVVRARSPPRSLSV